MSEPLTEADLAAIEARIPREDAYTDPHHPGGDREDLVRLVAEVRRLTAEQEALRSEKDALHATRRDAHLALSPARVRTHFLTGEDPQHPTGREVGLVERVGLLVKAHERAMAFIDEQAREECYVICGCQYGAERTRDDIAETLGWSK